jgi:hypothetical protein
LRFIVGRSGSSAGVEALEADEVPEESSFRFIVGRSGSAGVVDAVDEPEPASGFVAKDGRSGSALPFTATCTFDCRIFPGAFTFNVGSGW